MLSENGKENKFHFGQNINGSNGKKVLVNNTKDKIVVESNLSKSFPFVSKSIFHNSTFNPKISVS